MILLPMFTRFDARLRHAMLIFFARRQDALVIARHDAEARFDDAAAAAVFMFIFAIYFDADGATPLYWRLIDFRASLRCHDMLCHILLILMLPMLCRLCRCHFYDAYAADVLMPRYATPLSYATLR